jgi:hypothetical protein
LWDSRFNPSFIIRVFRVSYSTSINTIKTPVSRRVYNHEALDTFIVYTLLVKPSAAVTVINTSVIPTLVVTALEAAPLAVVVPFTRIVLPDPVGVKVMLAVPLGTGRLYEY